MQTLVDRIDLRIVGDRLQRHVGHGLVDEAALQPFVRIAQFEVVVAGRHQPRLGQRDRDARGVAGDPAAAPLLSNEGRGTGTAGGIEDEVAGVGGHEEATLHRHRARLNHIHLPFREARRHGVVPQVRQRYYWEILEEPCVSKRIAECEESTRSCQPSEAGALCLEGSLAG